MTQPLADRDDIHAAGDQGRSVAVTQAVESHPGQAVGFDQLDPSGAEIVRLSRSAFVDIRREHKFLGTRLSTETKFQPEFDLSPIMIASAGVNYYQRVAQTAAMGAFWFGHE